MTYHIDIALHKLQSKYIMLLATEYTRSRGFRNVGKTRRQNMLREQARFLNLSPAFHTTFPQNCSLLLEDPDLLSVLHVPNLRKSFDAVNLLRIMKW